MYSAHVTLEIHFLYSDAWSVSNDWYTGGLGLALSYDVLYNSKTDEDRRTVRSALGVMVKDRWHWGIHNPNAIDTPHRIFLTQGFQYSFRHVLNIRCTLPALHLKIFTPSHPRIGREVSHSPRNEPSRHPEVQKRNNVRLADARALGVRRIHWAF